MEDKLLIYFNTLFLLLEKILNEWLTVTMRKILLGSYLIFPSVFSKAGGVICSITIIPARQELFTRVLPISLQLWFLVIFLPRHNQQITFLCTSILVTTHS